MIDIKDCKMCNLCNSRLHISKNIGRVPANVLFIFDKQYEEIEIQNREELFIKRLNELLEWDWYKAYAMRCFPIREKITYDNIEACRKQLGLVIKQVNPYLVILFGKVPVKMIFGEKYQDIPRNIFYSKTNKMNKKRIYFLAPKISAPISALEISFNKISNYIQECYK